MNDENIKNGAMETSASDECQKCAEYLAGWKRAQADYANLKRETDKEKTEFAKYANERLLESLLPAIDQYETALAFLPDLSTLSDEQQKQLKNWIIGLQGVRATWEVAFQSIGLKKVTTDGTFDPLVHEAVSQEPSKTASEGAILRVVQSGWMLNGKLLRPARVIVASSKS